MTQAEPPNYPADNLQLATVIVVSFAVMMLELGQARILSFIFWTHMVYLTISVALLGFGISGTLVAVLGRKIHDWRRLTALCLMMFSFAIFNSIFTTTMLPLMGLDNSWQKIAVCYAAFLLPFVCAGAVLSLVFANTKRAVGKLYAADLVAAGLAGLSFAFLWPIAGPIVLFATVGITSSVLCFCWCRANEKKMRLGAAASLLLSICLAVVGYNNASFFLPELGKGFSWWPGRENIRISKTVWTPLCRIDVIEKISPGKPTGKWPFPDGVKQILQDASADTWMPSKEHIKKLWQDIRDDAEDVPITVLPYTIRPHADVGIIGLGGGLDVANALGAKAKSVFGAELNPWIYRFLTSDFDSYTGGLLKQPCVVLHNEEGRSAMRRFKPRLDVFQMVGIDTFAASANGAYVLNENYLYTVEAFKEYLDRLKPDGLLSILRWMRTPPLEMLRLTGVASDALRQDGAQAVSKHLMVVESKDHAWCELLVKRSPFTQQEVAELLKHCQRQKLDVLFWPKVTSSGVSQIDEPAYYSGRSKEVLKAHDEFTRLIDAFDSNQQKNYFSTYPYKISPVTDDAPFFFEYNKKSFLEPERLDDLRGNQSELTLYIVIAEATVLMMVAVFLPLWKFARDGIAVRRALPYSSYFAFVGVGFMLLEVALAQKCVLFLGNPLYSISVVLTTILLSAGLGSWLAYQCNLSMNNICRHVGPLFLLVTLAVCATLGQIIHSLLNLPLLFRIIVTFITLFPMGVLMGSFFPVGMKSVKNRAADYLPWAWGINGCAAVYGSFFAILMAMSFGFTAVLLLGCGCYLVAIVSAKFTELHVGVRAFEVLGTDTEIAQV